MIPRRTWIVAAGLAASTCGAALAGVADEVTLKDGKVVLGQVVETSPRGGPTVLVRRAWAEANVPEHAGRWAKAEEPAIRQAREQRLRRLAEWRRERQAGAGAGAGGKDRIGAWLDAQLEKRDGEDEPAPLMVVRLPRGEVKDVKRRPKAEGRLLRAAWLAGVEDPEGQSRDELTQAVEARGLLPAGDDPLPLDGLLPPRPEPDDRWLARRAATEIQHDEGLRFLRHEALVLPEPEPGRELNPQAALDAVGGLKGLLEGNPRDAWSERLREVEARGRVGVMVTQLGLAPDFSGAQVEVALWVRRAPGRWAPYGSKSAAAAVGDVRPDAGAELEADPQVQSIFNLANSLGIAALPPEVKQRALGVGAAAQQALRNARGAFQKELDTLAIDLEPARPAAAAAARP